MSSDEEEHDDLVYGLDEAHVSSKCTGVVSKGLAEQSKLN